MGWDTQEWNLIFVLVIIFINAAITHAQTCGYCKKTAKSTFRYDRKSCKDDFRSGAISTRAEFTACKMRGKSRYGYGWWGMRLCGRNYNE